LIENFNDLKIDFSIYDIVNGGILDHWRSEEKRKLIHNNKGLLDSEQELNKKYNSLNLDQLQSSLYLFLIGVICSLLMFIIEFIKNNKFSKRSHILSLIIIRN
jgi:hypothetical protein